jgi:hypothetical protein
LFRWELEDLARDQLAAMPPKVQLALSDFMDAVVIVDPAEYQRRPDEPQRPLRAEHGPAHGTFDREVT